MLVPQMATETSHRSRVSPAYPRMAKISTVMRTRCPVPTKNFIMRNFIRSDLSLKAIGSFKALRSSTEFGSFEMFGINTAIPRGQAGVVNRDGGIRVNGGVVNQDVCIRQRKCI